MPQGEHRWRTRHQSLLFDLYDTKPSECLDTIGARERQVYIDGHAFTAAADQGDATKIRAQRRVQGIGLRRPMGGEKGALIGAELLATEG